MVSNFIYIRHSLQYCHNVEIQEAQNMSHAGANSPESNRVVKCEKLIQQDKLETSYLQLIGSNEEPTYVMIPDCKGTIKDQYVYDATNDPSHKFDVDYEVCQRSPKDEFKVEENPCYCQVTQ